MKALFLSFFPLQLCSWHFFYTHMPAHTKKHKDTHTRTHTHTGRSPLVCLSYLTVLWCCHQRPIWLKTLFNNQACFILSIQKLHRQDFICTHNCTNTRTLVSIGLFCLSSMASLHRPWMCVWVCFVVWKYVSCFFRSILSLSVHKWDWLMCYIYLCIWYIWYNPIRHVQYMAF